MTRSPVQSRTTAPESKKFRFCRLVALYSASQFDSALTLLDAPAGALRRPRLGAVAPAALRNRTALSHPVPPHTPPFVSISRGFLKIEWAAGWEIYVPAVVYSPVMAAKGAMKVAVSFGLVAFLLLGTVGLSSAGMPTASDGHMPNCPLTQGHAAVCKMNPLEHFATWQSMLTTVLPGTITVLLLLIAMIVVITRRRLRLLFCNEIPQPFPHAVYDVPTRPTVLQELFSSGVLNPKVF